MDYELTKYITINYVAENANSTCGIFKKAILSDPTFSPE